MLQDYMSANTGDHADLHLMTHKFSYRTTSYKCVQAQGKTKLQY